uniref:Uncharacterized protein n=1 Tax=Anguilla anguilla TaxID=7936 RepID=A0A0E9W485_ANGAN
MLMGFSSGSAYREDVKMYAQPLRRYTVAESTPETRQSILFPFHLIS